MQTTSLYPFLLPEVTIGVKCVNLGGGKLLLLESFLFKSKCCSEQHLESNLNIDGKHAVRPKKLYAESHALKRESRIMTAYKNIQVAAWPPGVF